MCIIAAKPAGIPMPSIDTIRTMWNHNSDGAGLMYTEGGRVRIRKGYMSLPAFEQVLAELADTVDLTATPLVMHFRIRTHGETNAECTHPFPITDSIGALKKLDIRTDVGVAHNGIISSVTPRKGISDTMEYIATQLAPLKRALPNFYGNKHARLMVQNAIGSRMVFLTQKGELHTIGDFVEDNGVLYSNTSYMPWTYRACSWRSYYADDFGVPYATDYADDAVDCLDLMWLEEPGQYLVLDGETIEAGWHLVDDGGCVYEYDFERDVAVYIPGAVAYNPSNTPVRFDFDKSEAGPVADF